MLTEGWRHSVGPDTGGTMNAHYDRIGQLAQQHQREMLADARRQQLGRELRHQQDRPARRIFSTASAITRRLAAVFARVGRAPARTPDAIWPTGPLSPGETPTSR
jgi:hypothetical protein